MRTITVEEHFMSPAYLDGPGKSFKEHALKFNPRGGKLFELLTDLGDGRVAAMDAAGVDMQVLSLNAPGTEQLDEADSIAAARETNDYILAAINKHPTRFAGLASLSIMAPAKAAEELETRVRRDGFKGWMLSGHNRGRYLDDKFYWPIFECADNLGLPIYLHPTRPPDAVTKAYYDGFGPGVSMQFAASAWGWHIETSIHVIRLILGGVFDRFPQLQVVVGHLGEGLPFMLPRLDRNLPMSLTGLKRPVGEYLRRNVHYTFGGFNFPATFLNTLLEVGVERIMFSVDYPYGSMAEAVAFLKQLPVSDTDRERIAHGNAEKLFALPIG